jgi:hypothetical protein
MRGISVKSSNLDEVCTLLPLLPLYVYFFDLPSLLRPSILFNCSYTCIIISCMYKYVEVIDDSRDVHVTPAS